MQIGTRLRYGMIAILDLARRGQAEPVRAVDIANAAGISKGYLEGLLASLRRAGLVRAVRGPGGGWQLTRSPAKIRPTQVYAVLEGPTALARCIECPESCDHSRGCASRRLWTSMSKALEHALREETVAQLAGLVKKSAAKKRAASKKRSATRTKKSSPRKKAKTAVKRGKTKTSMKVRARRAKTKMRVVKNSSSTKKVVRSAKRLKRSA
jgi:Rrf2 family iron-sulfur cluster assembly transcriptional regulator